MHSSSKTACLFLRITIASTVVLAALVSAAHAEDSPRESVQARIIAAGLEDTFAADWLETLCDAVGPRLSGSPGLRNALKKPRFFVWSIHA